VEQVTIATGAGSWSTLSIAQFSLAYDLEPVKVREELKEKLNSFRGAKGIEVEKTENRCYHIYRVTFPNQMIDGLALTAGVIAGELENLENEIRAAVRVKDVLGMLRKEN